MNIATINNVTLTKTWANDETLASYFDVKKLRIQTIIREMLLDPVGSQYVLNIGKRITNIQAFQEYCVWREEQRYKIRKQPFECSVKLTGYL